MTRIPNYSILKRLQASRAVVHGCGSCRGRRIDGVNDIAKWERNDPITAVSEQGVGDVMEIKEI
eukprot:15354390-Ditylum_brightwellii.AAC.1